MSRGDDDLGDEERSKPSRPGLPIDINRILRAILRGKWWLLTAALLGSVLGYLVGKFAIPRSYETSAVVRYDGQPGENPMERQGALPSLVAPMFTDPLILQVRERSELDEVPIEAMRTLTEIQSDPGSGMVTFIGRGESAQSSADLANNLKDTFLEHHQQRRRSELQTELESIDERRRSANAALGRSRRTYDQFRQDHGITRLEDDTEAAITRAAELRSQANLARAEIQSLEARVRQLRESLANTPETETVSGTSPRVQALQGELASARANYSDDHPRVRALKAQIAAARRSGTGTSRRSSLHSQIRTQLQEAETELEATRERQVSLENQANEAQSRVSEFGEMEGEASQLLAAVEVNQALVNELNTNRAQSVDQLRNIETGFRVVSTARPPESPVPSKRKYIVAAGIPIFFVMVMLGMLLFRELRGLKILTPAEVAWWGNGPVIGTTTWPRDPRALIDLIADMDDYAPEAKGTMLLVGATEAERELAGEIAGQLNHDWQSTTLIDVPVAGALPPPGSSSAVPPPGNSDPYHEDDDALIGEIHDGPTEIMLAHHGAMAAGAMAPHHPQAAPMTAADDPSQRLICTAWAGPPEGQALRRAARLADRVLVVVTSNVMRAPDLAQTKNRLGRAKTVGYVLIGVSDAITKLPDRAGPVDDFWQLDSLYRD